MDCPSKQLPDSIIYELGDTTPQRCSDLSNRVLEEIATSSMNTTIKFNNLPLEIVLRIWELVASEPRTINITRWKIKKIGAARLTQLLPIPQVSVNPRIPSLLQVNRQSRSIGLSIYQKWDISKIGKVHEEINTTLFVNPDVDSVRFDLGQPTGIAMTFHVRMTGQLIFRDPRVTAIDTGLGFAVLKKTDFGDEFPWALGDAVCELESEGESLDGHSMAELKARRPTITHILVKKSILTSEN